MEPATTPLPTTRQRLDESTAMDSATTCDQYTLGWIAALPLELAAAIAMLDCRYEKPSDLRQSPSDKNAYTWGRIGEHHVVIASLSAGSYGTISAATTASQMLSSFPQIRFGLMVGIGAAIPRPEEGWDIRLGDIVVSQPDGRSGGVIQYDLGKAKPGGFERKGILNMPSEALLKTLAKLQAIHDLQASGIPKFLREMIKNYPEMAKTKSRRAAYMHQGQENDRLFASSYAHTGGSGCKRCDPAQVVDRDDRESNEPQIHYGVIASGNTVVKDAKFRDSIVEDAGEECICIEMEAAGLMNSFPCLVIRGICDYADSHKNDRWQPYAAATAAAYAKEFLGVLPGDDVANTTKAADIVKGIEKLHSKVDKLEKKMHNTQLDADQSKVLQWLSAHDPESNYQKGMNLRQPKSGSWFLKGDDFKSWKAQRNSFLWLHGRAGCGKTILSSAIIENLKSLHLPLLFFYFDFADASKQTLTNMVPSLIKELFLQRKDTWNLLKSIYDTCGGQKAPTCSQLCGTLQSMLQQTTEVFIVLDALDECTTRKGNSATESLLLWIREFANLDHANIHFLVTSRSEQDIEAGFNGWVGTQNRIRIDSELVSSDIHAYVQTRVREHDGLKRWRAHPDIQKEIETTLNAKADGMFRWVACQLDVLEECLDPLSLKEALATLPQTLDETYRRILDGIPERHKRISIRILQLLIYSERPLRIEEVVDAISININESLHFDPKHRMPDPLEISRYCSSLVALVSTGGFDGRSNQDDGKYKGEATKDKTLVLQLAHFSVNEYLRSSRLERGTGQFFQEIAAKGSISTICLAYLLHVNGQLSSWQIRDTYPFAQYCARYWMASAAVAEGNNETLQKFIKIFIGHKRAYEVCYALYRPDEPWKEDPIEHIEAPASPLYYMSLGGMIYTTNWLLDNNADVNSQGGKYGNALYAASFRGHPQVVERLLEAGADVNSQGGKYGSALCAASNRGHLQVVERLLEAGADVNAQDGDYGDALCLASNRGHLQVVERLLEAGADVNTHGGDYCNALYAASDRGHLQVVERLLEAGADVNAHGGDYGNALSAASDGCYLQVVERLLEAGADVNAQGGYYGNALYAASDGGYLQVVERLLEAGADVNAQGGDYGNALYAASDGGYLQVVERLLEAGADVNAQGGFYDNAFCAASGRGHLQVVERLLEAGADVNAQGGGYRNALRAALLRGHQQAAERLREAGAKEKLR